MDFVQASPEENKPEVNRQNSPGCAQIGVFLLLTGWIVIITLVVQGVLFGMEQAIFEGSFEVPDVRWLVGIGYGLAVLVPALILWAAASNLPTRRFYAALAFAGAFAALVSPARAAGLTNALGAAVLQAILALVFIMLHWLFFSRRAAGRWTWDGWAAALFIGGVLGVPWVLWGALGSAWDVGLNLAAALLFGAAAARILAPMMAQALSRSTSSVLLDGFVAALILLVMATGIGANGSQGLLALSLPVLGWGLAALFHQSLYDAGPQRRNAWALALLAGLAAFWPMAFIDPDELALIVASGTNELIQWANTAAVVGLLVAVLVSAVLVAVRSRLSSSRPVWSAAVAAGPWVLLAALYLLVGQPGLYGERLFVILREQADLSAAAQIEDPSERRAFVYNSLVAHADRSQAPLRAALDRLAIAYQPYYLENALEVEAGPLVRLWLEQQPEVDRVLDSPRMRPLPAPVPQDEGFETLPAGELWNLQMIQADRVHKELGVTGEGILVGQSDSGVQGDHPELADSYRGNTDQERDSWFDPWYATQTPTDIGGHGTHTLGTVLGNQVGVAPGAQWIGCVNLARNLGNPALYLDCMQFMLAPFPAGGDPLRDGRPERGANVLNNSWGCPPVEGCDPNALLAAVSALRAAGVFVVASAGNEGLGGCGSVSDPIALYDAAYSVGAVGQNGQLAEFSSTGPVEVDGSGRTKPDIAAPGAGVLSAYPGSTYRTASGTSMAGPHVAGVVALMWSANPDLIGDIDRTEQILNETAQPYRGALPECVAGGVPNNAAGYGIVDAYEAVRRALDE